ncbi:MAG TPA: hypothetical protein VFA42_00025 [Gaiellaceae bacterium]|jgi:hypothetical protein|nr:hypothetical protein [Gaiellaceae bacterium]
MTLERHRCSVDGCPNLAAYEVHRYVFDLEEGAVAQVVDESCPYICVEHALQNERGVTADRMPWSIVDYPLTNANRAPGIAVYVQLEPAYVA